MALGSINFQDAAVLSSNGRACKCALGRASFTGFFFLKKKKKKITSKKKIEPERMDHLYVRGLAQL